MATLGGLDVASISGPAARAAEPRYRRRRRRRRRRGRAVDRGGRRGGRRAPADAGPGGRAATCADPQGAAFRLWQARRRLGAQLTNMPGAWNFSDLHTPDPAAAQPFYAAVLRLARVDPGSAPA